MVPVSIKHMNEIYGLSVADDRTHHNSADSTPADLAAPQVPLERLEERICELAAHLAAGTCRFLQLVAEFDARGGWASWDLPSCAAWLAWKCQVAPGTAREQVRVARAPEDLPVICEEFAAGRTAGLADKLDLDLAVWAAVANNRLDRETSEQHKEDLAA